jgi:hypothetical protein
MIHTSLPWRRCQDCPVLQRVGNLPRGGSYLSRSWPCCSFLRVACFLTVGLKTRKALFVKKPATAKTGYYAQWGQVTRNAMHSPNAGCLAIAPQVRRVSSQGGVMAQVGADLPIVR